MEEKIIGMIDPKYNKEIREFPNEATQLTSNINGLMSRSGLPFLGTDRNVLNLPGGGKSRTCRTIKPTAMAISARTDSLASSGMAHPAKA